MSRPACPTCGGQEVVDCSCGGMCACPDCADAPPAPDPLSVEGARAWLQAKYGTDAEWKGDDLLAYARHATEALRAEVADVRASEEQWRHLLDDAQSDVKRLRAEVEALALARNRLQTEVGEWITEATKQQAEVARLKAALDEAP